MSDIEERIESILTQTTSCLPDYSLDTLRRSPETGEFIKREVRGILELGKERSTPKEYSDPEIEMASMLAIERAGLYTFSYFRFRRYQEMMDSP